PLPQAGEVNRRKRQQHYKRDPQGRAPVRRAATAVRLRRRRPARAGAAQAGVEYVAGKWGVVDPFEADVVDVPAHSGRVAVGADVETDLHRPAGELVEQVDGDLVAVGPAEILVDPGFAGRQGI